MTKKLLYILVIASLAGSNNFAIPILEHQLSLFRLVLIVCVLALLINLIHTRGIIRLSKNPANYSIFFFVLWLIYSLISIIWVKDYSSWARSIYFLGIGVVSMILFITSFKAPKDFLGVFKVISIMAFVHNIIGWHEVVTGQYWLLEKNSIPTYRLYEAAVSIFGNMNNFALFLCLAIFSLIICIKTERFFTMKVLYILTLFSSVILLINHTHSRGNIIGFAFGIVLVLYLTLNNKDHLHLIRRLKYYLKTMFLVRGSEKISSFKLISIAIIASLLIGTGTYILIGNVQQLFSVETGSASVRINLIRNGLLFLADTNGMGTGAGNVEYWMANFGTFNTSGITSMHNWWIEILVGYGLIIFVTYLIFYYKLLSTLFVNWRTSCDSVNKTISLNSLGFMVAFIIGSISPSSVFILEWLWIIWGLLVAYQLQIASSENRSKKSGISDGRVIK